MESIKQNKAIIQAKLSKTKFIIKDFSNGDEAQRLLTGVVFTKA
jgi:hypothetical protein